MFVDESDISSETTMEKPPPVPIRPPFVPEPGQSVPIHFAQQPLINDYLWFNNPGELHRA